ncbi:hypothetical protein [Tautonia plasticadhaerens]|uniref:hypothetical protein n=1 Tax=Tautonia plasticadhaerens TaxID=2527974 RepID=UPI0011A6920B|nr:hypothetical protein [Tautonia plasticadhaerens]
MGWKTIKGRRYYYRSRREAGRVVTEYFGQGERGARFALLDMEDREERQIEREEELEEREAAERQERELSEWFDRVEAVAHAALIAAGFHRHKRGEWRRRRDVPDEHATGGVGSRAPHDPGRD